MNRPYIGIPMGDPAGIGPEIVVKAIAREEINRVCKPAVIGSVKLISKYIAMLGLALKVRVIESSSRGSYETGMINVVDLDNIEPDSLKLGSVQAGGGTASYQYIKKCVELAKAGQLEAIATTPINKQALKAGNVDFIGHTEILAALTDTPDPLTMFEVRGMRVFFLTRHVSLAKACELVTEHRLLDYIDRCTGALKSLGITEGIMAVAGLNPHSGDNGMFGAEELKEIAPAVEKAKKQGYGVEGPISADSVFHQALTGKYNSVLSLYHDQGHIATKTLDFERTIAITMGLPFLRTSVDHGTAYDIAGKGIASDVSMAEAILLASKYAAPYSAWYNNKSHGL
ncbi:4-hydroxythreonine-4-phosphate dehydrogenase 2 [Ruminiclostridium hungatei]|uniref:4-hydroxythreonine-4-phosphate dehydrogenase 2 n=1 Tax=Ruminiclostridium hungatei TaxID=48256 RepID=A0A1V4SGG4_RUMHU|nr:4-hydroxythreonine-4-phosphate dehydrogenase PdxA [Ruminiclostridium hungatei]OPX42884.1 4-hydroxythreonine-4-phosphate dehydrogenase 2 [Ruminiclostridium hungatei]